MDPNNYTGIKRTKDISYVPEQPYRPFWHFSCEKNAMNDPNGLFYDAKEGVYHLYYQYNSRGMTIAANTCWGHAVSGNLVHWVEQDIAIKTGKLGLAWSGSCVVDEDNTSGFFDDSIDPRQRVVAIYTNVANGHQQQSVAYSLDGGYTFNAYEGDPVLDRGYKGAADFRDPKVLKYYDERFARGYIWVMIVGGGTLQLYTSEDLKEWKHNSIIKDMNGNIIESECPDMFCLPVDGDESNCKWVLSHSGSYYYLGELFINDSGKFEFKCDSADKRFLTPNTAALQTYYNTPDGKRIAFAWQGDMTVAYVPGFEDKAWDGCHTTALECKLITNKDGEVIMTGYPIREYEMLRDELILDVKDAELEADVSELGAMGIDLRVGDEEKTALTYDRKDELLKVNMRKSSSLRIPPESLYSQPLKARDDGTISLRIICDGMSVEMFGNGGEIMFENIVFPKESSDGTSFTVSKGKLKIKSLKVYSMKNIFE